MNFIKKYWWMILIGLGIVYYFAFHKKGKGIFSTNTPTPDNGSEAEPGVLDVQDAILLPEDDEITVTR